MSRLGNIGGRLYRGEVSIDFVGRQKLWYTISGIILVVAAGSLLIFGLNFSIDFKGGTQFQFPAPRATATQVEKVVSNAGGGAYASAQEVKPIGKPSFWQVQTGTITVRQQGQVETAINKAFNPPRHISGISVQSVSSSWGSQITQKAVIALIAFMIVIVAYLSIAFDWRMAAAAFVALAHDIIITIGVYALAQFQVSPATVIGLLTILGYSLYDTVVVFDKVRENTAPILGTRKSSYSQAANLALNQTLVRSINTSLIALLPVAAILAVGALLLGNGELKDLSLVLFVGMLSGTYSSICIATPVLADLKERMPEYQQLAKQVARQEAGGRAAIRRARAEAAAGAGRRAGNGATDETPTTIADEDEALETGQPPADTVPASHGAVSSGQVARTPGARPPGQRQQPVRRSSGSRRPSGKKKRR